jgi:hypothetical protein
MITPGQSKERILFYKNNLKKNISNKESAKMHFIVIKNFLKNLNKLELIDIIKNNNINIVHIDEMIECLDSYTKAPELLFDKIYDKNRTWRVVETCHNVWFNPDTSKKYSPDGYAFCTPWHQIATFKHMPSKNMVAEFPIENNIPTIEEKTEAKKQLGFDLDKKHVINVGLWTQAIHIF